jgi:hypothetical protein
MTTSDIPLAGKVACDVAKLVAGRADRLTTRSLQGVIEGPGGVTTLARETN